MSQSRSSVEREAKQKALSESLFIKRAKRLIKDVQPAEELDSIPLQARLDADGVTDKLSSGDIEKLENLYKEANEEKQLDCIKEIHETYSKITEGETLIELFNAVQSVDKTALEHYKASIFALGGKQLGTIGISADTINAIEQHNGIEYATRMKQFLACIRTEWYIYSGFMDTKLLYTYIELGKSKGMTVEETISTYIDPIATKGNEKYYLAFSAKFKKGEIVKPKILAHIGIVHAAENVEAVRDEIYNPQKHLLHIDHVYLNPDETKEGMRVLVDVPKDVQVKNIFEIVRFVKNPFVRNSKNTLAPMLVMNRVFRELRNIKDNYIVCADLDENVAGKNLGATGVLFSKSDSSLSTPARLGLLAPRWRKDPFLVVDTSPKTVACSFSKADLEQVDQDLFFNRIEKLANIRNPFLRLIAGFQLLKTGASNMLHSKETGNIGVNAKRESRQSTQSGPDGLSLVKDTEEAAKQTREILPKAMVVPLLAETRIDLGTWSRNPDQEIIKRVRALNPWGASDFAPTLITGSIHGILSPLGAWVNVIEEKPTQRLFDKLARQAAYYELYRQNLIAFLKDTYIHKLPKWVVRYFIPPIKTTKEVDSIRARDGIIEYAKAVSEVIYIQSGEGTGGAALTETILTASPSSHFIIMDRGVIESDNVGHQPWSPSEIGASKVAAVAHRAMEKHSFAPWGDPTIYQPKMTIINDFYSPEIDDDLIELIRTSGAKEIVLIDEIDVTDATTIRAKLDFHRFAIKLARLTKKPVTVNGGLDVGMTATIGFTEIYTGEEGEKPFHGLFELKQDMEQFFDRLSPFVMLAPLFTLLADGIPPELQQILTSMAKKNNLDGVPQTVFSSVGSAQKIGEAALVSAMMQSVGMDAEMMRAARKRASATNTSMEELTANGALKRFLERAPGNDGIQLVDYMLYLSSMVYDTTAWPVTLRNRLDYIAAFYQKTARSTKDGML